MSHRGLIPQEIILQEVIPEEDTPQEISSWQVIPQEIVPVARTTVSVSRSPGARRWDVAKSQRLLSFSARNRLPVANIGPNNHETLNALVFYLETNWAAIPIDDLLASVSSPGPATTCTTSSAALLIHLACFLEGSNCNEASLVPNTLVQQATQIWRQPIPLPTGTCQLGPHTRSRGAGSKNK